MWQSVVVEQNEHACNCLDDMSDHLMQGASQLAVQ